MRVTGLAWSCLAVVPSPTWSWTAFPVSVRVPLQPRLSTPRCDAKINGIEPDSGIGLSEMKQQLRTKYTSDSALVGSYVDALRQAKSSLLAELTSSGGRLTALALDLACQLAQVNPCAGAAGATEDGGPYAGLLEGTFSAKSALPWPAPSNDPGAACYLKEVLAHLSGMPNISLGDEIDPAPVIPGLGTLSFSMGQDSTFCFQACVDFNFGGEGSGRAMMQGPCRAASPDSLRWHLEALDVLVSDSSELKTPVLPPESSRTVTVFYLDQDLLILALADELQADTAVVLAKS